MSQEIMYRKIKFPHYDNLGIYHPNTYYNLIKNSSEKFKNEISDIYFGKFFKYTFNGIEKIYGNAMGLEATSEQIDNLFRIQKEFDIPICLTMNSLETPHELLYDERIIKLFINFLGEFYERGLRHCILASPHLLASQLLQQNFPEMRWENTVNQKVIDAQSVIDLLFNGYNTIMVDRRLNRDLKELKKIRKAVDYFNEKYKPIKKAKICLLISESCIYNCPFKKEHDSIGEYISGQYFGSLSKLSCDNWRFTDFGLIPRNGIDLISSSKEVFEEFNQLVDIFKFSGRFTQLPFNSDVSDNYKLVWLFTERDNVSKLFHNSTFKSNNDETIFSDCFSEIIEKDLQPIHSWIHGYALNDYTDYKDKINLIDSTESIWKTDEGKRLEQILKTCKSQCWNCHECEKTFKTRLFDSGLQLNENLYNAIR